ncbi:DUF177 domain-containing protein [Thalassovita sp.]|uniref:YceD family protein n=1 Tax=Thalassovita sp. TaxID=1979401 RepID=UPI0029DE62FA|nr:DUF177 domain-containing protein [Thalassovita sp.]
MTNSPSTALRVADLSQTRPTRFELTPDVQELETIAAELGLLSLRKMRFVGQIVAEGKRDWRLEAQLGATVTQPCVVTLAPVTTRIDEPVIRRFLAMLPEQSEADDEFEMPEDDSVEQLGTEIDTAAVMIEALSLSLPLYPRAEGAVLEQAGFTESGKTALTDEDLKPFAGLAALRDQLTRKDGSEN